MWNGQLKRVEAVVQRQQRMPTKGDDDRLFFGRKSGRSRFLRAGRRSATEVRFLHLATVLGLIPQRLESALRLS